MSNRKTEAAPNLGDQSVGDDAAEFSIRHSMVEVNGAQLHVARTGEGRPLLLLHGWPEFWFTWKPMMERLSDRFELIAPDLRGFGDSDKPVGDFGPEDQAIGYGRTYQGA
jgi:pimeloyl-ACP methyl ester carboxylesterase